MSKGKPGKAKVKRKSKTKDEKAAPKPNGNGSVRAGVTLTTKDMVHNSLLYFLLMQHKKLPVKRADIIKHAMNDQGKEFPAVMNKLSSVFDDVSEITNLITITNKVVTRHNSISASCVYCLHFLTGPRDKSAWLGGVIEDWPVFFVHADQ
jgi:hypothetical protein